MDFKKDVIERSNEVPVLVDFWAPWCGPCLVLGPIIEEAAAEAEGKWELQKVNTDEEQDLGDEFQIRSIPTVILFWKGKPLNQFSGALQKSQLIDWVGNNLPTEADELFGSIHRSLVAQEEGAIDQLEDFVNSNPGHEESRITYARLIVMRDALKARDLVKNQTMGSRYFEIAEDIRHISNLIEFDDKGQNGVASHIKEARDATKKQDMDHAISELIEAVKIDKRFENDLPRKAAIAIFHLLGHDNLLTQKYHKKFEMALY
ncbi:MAG: thioredoxin [Bacteroidetes bacterium]|nr:thioredoxin [Bacteroidota bacterium]